MAAAEGDSIGLFHPTPPRMSEELTKGCTADVVRHKDTAGLCSPLAYSNTVSCASCFPRKNTTEVFVSACQGFFLFIILFVLVLEILFSAWFSSKSVIPFSLRYPVAWFVRQRHLHLCRLPVRDIVPGVLPSTYLRCPSRIFNPGSLVWGFPSSNSAPGVLSSKGVFPRKLPCKDFSSGFSLQSSLLSIGVWHFVLPCLLGCLSWVQQLAYRLCLFVWPLKLRLT